MRHAENRSLIGKVVIILILADWRQQQQPDERNAIITRNMSTRRLFSVLSSITQASTSSRQRRANAIGEIRCLVGRLRNVINEGTPPQLLERQIRVHPTGMIEITVDQPIEQMTNVELAGSAGGIRITYDVDRAAVGQEMVELWPIGKFVDPFEINQQQPSHALDR